MRDSMTEYWGVRRWLDVGTKAERKIMYPYEAAEELWNGIIAIAKLPENEKYERGQSLVKAFDTRWGEGEAKSLCECLLEAAEDNAF
jgi:hypothetical protein